MFYEPHNEPAMKLATITLLLATTTLAAPTPADKDPNIVTPLPPNIPNLPIGPCKYTPPTCVGPWPDFTCQRRCKEKGFTNYRISPCGFAPIQFSARCCCLGGVKVVKGDEGGS